MRPKRVSTPCGRPYAHARLPGGEAWRGVSADGEILAVLKGGCRLTSAAGQLDVDESFAAFLPAGADYSCEVAGEGCQFVFLPLGAQPAGGALNTIARLEDSHSYYLLSRLLRSALAGECAPAMLLTGLANHIGGLAHAERNDPAVGRVVDLVHAEPNDAPSLDALADLIRIHPMTLARRFRRERGCSIGEFRQRVRAERAFYRTIKSPNALSAISAICGYADQSHMTRAFRRFFDITPARLRSLAAQAPAAPELFGV